MKHIKKSFLFQKEMENFSLDPEKFEIVDIKDSANPKLLENRKNELILLSTENNKLIGAFSQKFNGKNYLFPIPDPTLIYFHSAQTDFSNIDSSKKKLMKQLDLETGLSESVINEFFTYYSLSSRCAIFLFTAIESFINQLIPDKYVFIKNTPQRTEHFNKQQIQEFIDFKTKMTVILPEVSSNIYSKRESPTMARVWNLKEYRDELIHTKPSNNAIKYDAFVQKALNFKFKETIFAVADFMNHYKANYIMECDCGKDF